jgi:hypothetical protein
MASTRTNRAVAAYRDVIKAERKLEQRRQAQENMAVALEVEEMAEYVKLTCEIDAAANAADEASDAAFASLVNAAGKSS